MTCLTRDVQVENGLLGYGATTPPCAHGGNARDEEKERFVGGSEGEVYEITYSPNIRLKGREGPVEVHGPLVI